MALLRRKLVGWDSRGLVYGVHSDNFSCEHIGVVQCQPTLVRTCLPEVVTKDIEAEHEESINSH
eukprot:5463055-Amphidinium_carterae.2